MFHTYASKLHCFPYTSICGVNFFVKLVDSTKWTVLVRKGKGKPYAYHIKWLQTFSIDQLARSKVTRPLNKARDAISGSLVLRLRGVQFKTEDEFRISVRPKRIESMKSRRLGCIFR